MASRLVLPFLLLISLAVPAQGGQRLDPPAELASRFAEAAIASVARRRSPSPRPGRMRVRVILKAAPGLEGAPALLAIGPALDGFLYGSGRLGEPDPHGDADLEITAELSLSRGRVVLGGALDVPPRGEVVRATVDWVLASSPETPEWWPWLEAAPHAAANTADAKGFVWRRVGAVDGEVRDADAGDLDGDGRAEFVAVTWDEVMVFALSASGPELIARAALTEDPAIEPSPFACRAPRTLARVVPGAGAPGEILVRRTDEERTRVFGWEPDRRLVRRADRDLLVLAAGWRGRAGQDLVTTDPPAGGVNRFDAPPRAKRGGGWKSPHDPKPWIDLRAAVLPPVAQLADQGPGYALLEASGSLRLLRSDLSDAGRVARCGQAYALTDWDGDGKAEPLCSGDGPASMPDRLVLGSGTTPRWTVEVDGVIVALAGGPVGGRGSAEASGGDAAALVFVRRPEASGTDVWMLRAPKDPRQGRAP